VLSEKNLIPPYGVAGGMGGACNRFTVVRSGRELEPSPIPGKVTKFLLRRGDVVIARSSGGGGYGDPLARSPAAIEADVHEGRVSEGAARTLYGAAMQDGVVDPDATAETRRQLLASRIRLSVIVGQDESAKDPAQVIINSQTADGLGLADGALAEIVNRRGAPLRAWVRHGSIPAGSCELSERDLLSLGLADGEPVEIRALDPWQLRSMG
jgi:N-methylhydantoinase B